jgi:hypothetical protein
MLTKHALRSVRTDLEYVKKQIHIYRPAYEGDFEMALLVGIALAAVGVALLNKVLKGSVRLQTNSTKRGREPNGQIIEIDEYEIVDDFQNRAPDGYKVEIYDGDD